MKLLICTIIVVISSNLIRKIPLNMLCSVPCYELQQIFFLALMGRHWAITTLNLKKSAMKVVICTIIVVITSNLIRKITLNILCSVRFTRFFFLALHGNAFSYHNFEIERSQYCKWYVPRTPNSSSIFQKQVAIAESGSPLTLFQLQDLSKFRTLAIDARIECNVL